MFKQIYKPNSVGSKLVSESLLHKKKITLSFIYAYCYQQTLAAYPLTIARVRSNVSLHDIAPHRVYLVSLQHYLYILSVALVRPAKSGRRVLPVMLHYGVRTFLPDGYRQVDKVTCSLQIYFNC